MIGTYNHVYFIGIGGSGMSAIAKILLECGYKVSGSDIKSSQITEQLKHLGAHINLGHSEKNIEGVDLVVFSSAISPDNPELAKAKELGIERFHRADALARIINQKKGIAVSGAHGKTTTTSMISLVLERAELNPTIIIGGEVNDIGGNARLGKGEYIVAEADESDGSFLKLKPHIAVITNIEEDHMDYYQTANRLKGAFIEFANNINPDGFVVIGADNQSTREIISLIPKSYFTFGINNPSDYLAAEINLNKAKTSFSVFFKQKKLGELELIIPGIHNIYNALATTAVAHQLGVPFENIREALLRFGGVHRRFELIGDKNGVKIFDDYAHHPTEIKATLQAAKQRKPERVIAVFQPHRYSRTANLYNEFGKAFNDADLVVITDIYPAGEKPISGVDSTLVTDAVEKTTGRKPVYIKGLDDIVEYLERIVKPGDYVLSIGAGDVHKVATELACRL